jgi:hypothetical protein
MDVSFLAANTNTAASTLAVNGGTAIAIKKWGGAAALTGGEIVAGQLVRVVFDGTNFQMQSQSGSTNVFSTRATITDDVTVIFLGGGYPISLNTTAYRAPMPFAGTITSWNVICTPAVGTSGITIDLWKIAYTANTLPVLANSICNSGTCPNIAGGSNTTATGSTFTSWGTTSFSAGDVFAFSVTTAPTASTLCTMNLVVNRGPN